MFSKPQFKQDGLRTPQTADSVTEPKPDDEPSESVVPPSNVSGTYLIGCEPQLTVNNEVRQLQMACQITTRDRKPLNAVGSWSAKIANALPGEAIGVLDAGSGSFRLQFVDKISLPSTLERTLLSFSGEVDGQALALETKARDTMDTGGHRFKNVVAALREAANKNNESTPKQESVLLCPDLYVAVPGDSRYGTLPFCVMKHEVMALVPIAEVQAPPSPAVNISQIMARQSCQALGPKFDLISNEEWMSIGVNIASVGKNWSSGVVGQGALNVGHSDSSPAMPCSVPSDESLAYVDIDCTAQAVGSFSQKRTHELSNGSIIWDFAGNVAEHTSFTLAPDLQRPYSSFDLMPVDVWRDYTTIDLGFDYLPLNRLRPVQGEVPFWDNAWDAMVGIGQYRAGSVSGGALQRGGGYANLHEAGLFAASLALGPADVAADVGYRCVYRP